MIDYFSNMIFSFSTIETKTTNVKQILIYYKTSHHFMSTIVYCDAESAFISREIKKTINENDITFVIAFSQFHKSIEMIKRVNRTLKEIMNKMKESSENMLDILRKVTSTCNERHVEHLEYFFIQILHEIDQTSTFVRFLSALIISKKIVLLISKKMLFLMWDYMIRRKKRHQNVVKRIIHAKQRMKERYDKKITSREFVFGQFVFFRNINMIYDKNIFRWRDFFVIFKYVEKHKSSYKLRKMNESKTFNFFHDDYLRIFNAKKSYFKSINEKKLTVIFNLKHQRKKIFKQQAKKN